MTSRNVAQEQLQAHGWIISRLPVAVFVVAVLTYLFCIIYAVLTDTYIGSIPFPYFSDTGRDKPAYYVFVIFLTLAAILMVPVFYYLHYAFLKPTVGSLEQNEPDAAEGNDDPGLPTTKTKNGCCSLNCKVTWASALAILSVPFLALLAIFDTAFHAEVHIYSAYIFFLLQLISMVLYVDLFRRLRNKVKTRQTKQQETIENQENPTNAASGKEDLSDTDNGISNDVDFWERTYRLKLGVSIVFAVAFLIYIPVGLAITCDFLRLSMEDCKEKYDLGDSYCDERAYTTTDDNILLTVLFDYSQKEPSVSSPECVNVNTMRSVAQFFTIVALLFYTATFAVDLDRASKVNPTTNEAA